MRILVVDNNEIVQKICVFVFEKLGHTVMTANSGTEALNLLAEEKFDFLFIELFLRDMSGLTILEKLKGQDILSVIMTGYHSIESVKRAVELGASNYLFKPVDPDSLEAMLVMCKRQQELEKIRLEAQQKLLESQQKYKTLVDSIQEGIVIIQNDTVRFVNKSFANLMGSKISRLVNRPMKEIFVSREATKVYKKLLEFIEQGTDINGCYSYRNWQEKKLMIEVTATKITFQNKPADMFVLHDVTESTETMKKMKKMEERYQVIQEHGSYAYLLVDADGQIREVNKTAQLMFSSTKKALLQMNIKQLFMSSGEERFLTFFDELKRVGGVPPLEFEMQRPNDGGTLIASISSVFMDFNSYLLFVFDVTTQKRDALRLQEYEHQCRVLLEHIPGILYHQLADGSLEFVGQKIEDLTGYKKEDFLEKKVRWQNLIYDSDRDAVAAAGKSMRYSKDKRVIEYRIVSRTEEIHWVQDHMLCLINNMNQLVGYEGVIFDITKQKSANLRLEDSERKFQNLVKHLPAIVYQMRYNENFLLLFVSPFIEHVLLYSVEECRALKENILIHNIIPEDHTFVVTRLKEICADGEQGFRLQYRMFDKNGGIRYVVNRGNAILTRQGSVEIDGTIVEIKTIEQSTAKQPLEIQIVQT